MKQLYLEKRFNRSSIETLNVINGVIVEYQNQGYVMTVRQLYYQLVARDVIANNLAEYKRVASLINNAKLAGLIDWDALHDLTRSFERRGRWDSGSQILHAVSTQFHKDMWDNQDHRVFVIVEKEALVGVLQNVCHRYDMPLLAARGYPSGSVLREFVVADLMPSLDENQQVTILHLGDHDPSGIDMTRDLAERIALFSDEEIDFGRITVDRIALNMPQIEELKPPHNPAKLTDSRVGGYVKKFGKKSWELDALSPSYLNNLVETHVDKYRDKDEWKKKQSEIDRVKTKLEKMANAFRD